MQNLLILSLLFLNFIPVGSAGFDIEIYLLLSLPMLCTIVLVSLYSILKIRESIPKASFLALLLISLIFLKVVLVLTAPSPDIFLLVKTTLPIIFIPGIILSVSYYKISDRSVDLLASTLAFLQAALCILALFVGTDNPDQRITSLLGYGSLTTSSPLFTFACLLYKSFFTASHNSIRRVLQAALLLSVAIFIVLSKSAALLIGASMIFLVSLYLKSNSPFLRFVSISLGAIFLVLISFLFLFQRIDEILSSTMLGRLDEAAAYFELFQSHVLFGAPYDQRVFFASLFEGDLNTGTVINPHNVFMFLLARQGIVGLILIVGSIFYFYLSRIRFNRCLRGSIQHTFWLTAAVAILIYNGTSTSYTSPSFALTLLITLMLSTAASTNKDSALSSTNEILL